MLLILQAATTPAIEIATLPEAARFDVVKMRAAEAKCGDDAAPDEVVVCARMTDLLPSLDAQAARFEPKPFRPNVKMLGGEGSVRAEQRGTIMGSAPAAMATFKLRF